MADKTRTLAPPRPNTVAATVVVVALLGFGVWSASALRINIATLIDSLNSGVDLLARALPLDFPAPGEIALLMAQTLAIVIVATLLSTLISAPLAFWAAANTAPNRGSRFMARAVIVCARAIPDVVLAIVFVRMIGLGVLPGVLAMGLHSVGMIGKLYADAIEQIDEGPRDALRASGATRRQQLIGSVLPQVLPAFVATAMHRLDINLRISVLLGYVGVAGIGLDIRLAFDRLDYDRGLALALVVLVAIVAMELISGAIRRSLLGPSAEPSRFGVVWLYRLVVRRREPRVVPADRERVVPPWTGGRVGRLVAALVAGVLVLASVAYVIVDLAGMGGGVGLWATLDRLWPPDTQGIDSADLIATTFETIQIAFAAMVIGAVVALPIGCLAARNVAPNSLVAKGLRFFIVCVRGVPELILAIVFVAMLGLGPVPGALALSIGAIGLLGKLVADSVEEVDAGVEQAMAATGASRPQIFFAATLPQALPAFIGHVLYQLDVNIRSSTLLGIVGAGGVGYYLLQASRVREFEAVTLITLIVFAVVMVVELLSIWLRHTAGAKGQSGLG